ncbi:MAG: hypothetical protein ABI193_05955, partial [Minicystis sp.]
MRSRLPQLSLFALLIAFLVLAGPAACNLVAGLDKLSFTDDAGALCTGAASCDDENACTDDTCAAEGSCAHAARPDGPSPLQFPGDCQSFTCEAGTPVTHFDPGDPEDDQNPCTADTCKDGST